MRDIKFLVAHPSLCDSCGVVDFFCAEILAARGYLRFCCASNDAFAGGMGYGGDEDLGGRVEVHVSHFGEGKFDVAGLEEFFSDRFDFQSKFGRESVALESHDV